MAKTYQELLKERDELDKAILEARKIEVASVVATIKGWVEEFGLTAEELGFKIASKQGTFGTSTVSSEGKVDKRTLPPIPKYSNPNNPSETWSGRGSKDKRSQWVRDFIQNGGDIESCRIK